MIADSERIAAFSQLSQEEMDPVQGGGDDTPTEDVSFVFAKPSVRYYGAAASDSEFKYVSVRRPV
jgi:hypothetical protein